jgi:hypothetical protein
MPYAFIASITIFPCQLSAARDVPVGGEGDSQNDDVGLDRVFNRLGDERRADLRRERVQWSPACHDYFDILTGKCLGDGRADLAKPDDCVAH